MRASASSAPIQAVSRTLRKLSLLPSGASAEVSACARSLKASVEVKPER